MQLVFTIVIYKSKLQLQLTWACCYYNSHVHSKVVQLGECLGYKFNARSGPTQLCRVFSNKKRHQI